MTEKASPLLLCAATRWEARPLAARWNLREVSPPRFSGAVKGVEIILIQTGIGPANVREALAGMTTARLAVSTGFAGALQPKMASGDLVLDVRGLDLAVPQTARAIAEKKSLPVHFGKIAHSDKVLFNPNDKAALGQAQRCSAVDMESAAIKAWADARSIPFLAARVVLDAVDEWLPAEVPAGEGLADLVPFALRNMGAFPIMIRLGLRQKSAAKRLGDFLEELIPTL